MHWWIWVFPIVPIVVMLIGVSMVQRRTVPTPKRNQDELPPEWLNSKYDNCRQCRRCITSAYGVYCLVWPKNGHNGSTRADYVLDGNAWPCEPVPWFSVEDPDSNDSDLPAPDYGRKIMP